MAANETAGSQHIINFFTPLVIPMLNIQTLVRERDGMRVYPEERLGMVIMGNDTTFPASAILDAAAAIDW
jgi:hypothetical protein